MIRELVLIAILALLTMPANAVYRVGNDQIVLCEPKPVGNNTTVEIIFTGSEISARGDNFDQRFFGSASVLIDYANRGLSIANRDKEGGRTIAGMLVTKAKSNEIAFVISGKDVNLVTPCREEVPVGGFQCSVNFTARRTVIGPAWQKGGYSFIRSSFYKITKKACF